MFLAQYLLHQYWIISETGDRVKRFTRWPEGPEGPEPTEVNPFSVPKIRPVLGIAQLSASPAYTSRRIALGVASPRQPSAIFAHRVANDCFNA
jgi:hypothetical protein